jgi:hypothetical protein
METTHAIIGKLRSNAMILGIIGVLGLAAMYFVGGSQQFFRSYLYGYIFWLCMALGCFGLTLLIHSIRAGWGTPIVRLLEAGAATLPWMGLLLIPIVIGANELYSWMDTQKMQTDPILSTKMWYLNQTGWIVRLVIYFVIWTIFVKALTRLSDRQDRTGDLGTMNGLSNWASPGIVMFMVTVNFLITDLVMSLDPYWYSTIYGVTFAVGQVISALTFMILLMLSWRGKQPFSAGVSNTRLHDWGKLLLAFTLFWTYVNLSQLLIIWSGNLPEEIAFYVRRNQTSWLYVSIAISVFHFFVPFLALLPYSTKVTPSKIGAVATMLLTIRAVDVYWHIAPHFHSEWTITIQDIAAFVGMGGIWIALFLTIASKRALVPAHDPRLQEVAHGH